jgi:hypothetical protein
MRSRQRAATVPPIHAKKNRAPRASKALAIEPIAIRFNKSPQSDDLLSCIDSAFKRARLDCSDHKVERPVRPLSYGDRSCPPYLTDH